MHTVGGDDQVVAPGGAVSERHFNAIGMLDEAVERNAQAHVGAHFPRFVGKNASQHRAQDAAATGNRFIADRRSKRQLHDQFANR
ncbi:hypothetical protein D3C84_859420 [compost metagenome]